jgi:hypothetical protein
VRPRRAAARIARPLNASVSEQAQMIGNILLAICGFILVSIVPALTTIRMIQVYRDATDGSGEPVGFFGGIGMLLLGAAAVLSWIVISLLLYSTFSKGDPNGGIVALYLPFLFVAWLVSEGLLLISGPSR